jgi:penicillin-binding protein 2
MQKRIPFKNHQQEILLIGQRSMLALGLIVFLIICLVIRLMFLQIVKHDVYTTMATNNWLDLVPVEPTRGLIYDRNGVLLAENIPVFSLDLVPVQITDLPKTLITLRKLVTLSDDEVSQYKRQVKQHRRFDEIPLKLRLTEEEVAKVTENLHRLPGVTIKARLMRNYPFGTSFSHVLGYVGRINLQELNEIDQTNYSASHYIGKLGIEKYYEDELHGKVGYQQVENNASGEAIRILKEIKGTPGKNIYLSLDSKLQFVVEKAMQGHRGAVVAIQPATGQVLAMVSEPGYDPNIFVQGISQTAFKALQQSPDKPLYNRALRGLYPIASTIKPYLALEGLNSGVISPDSTVYDPGWFKLRSSEHIFHDWWHQGHGTVNVSRAITSSCDIFFYELGMKMGIRRMDNILTQFGFGALSGIDLDDELPGIVASPDWKQKMRGGHWYEGDTVNSSIGQGLMQASPLQLATAIATLANRGQRFIPYLLMGEQLPGKPYVLQPPIPLESIQVPNKQYWELVIKAMQNVVDTPQGTAFRFGQNRNYTLAAKTGTAQVIARRGNLDEKDNQNLLPERLREHHLFIAFAPVENPTIAIAIITENSYMTIDVARDIFDYYVGKQNNANRTAQAEIQKTAA